MSPPVTVSPNVSRPPARRNSCVRSSPRSRSTTRTVPDLEVAVHGPAGLRPPRTSSPTRSGAPLRGLRTSRTRPAAPRVFGSPYSAATMASQSVVLPVSFGSTASSTRPSGQARSRSRSAPNPSMRMRSIFIGPRPPAAGPACPRSASRPSRSARSATRRSASSAAAARDARRSDAKRPSAERGPGSGAGGSVWSRTARCFTRAESGLRTSAGRAPNACVPGQRHAHEVRRLGPRLPGARPPPARREGPPRARSRPRRPPGRRACRPGSVSTTIGDPSAGSVTLRKKRGPASSRPRPVGQPAYAPRGRPSLVGHDVDVMVVPERRPRETRAGELVRRERRGALRAPRRVGARVGLERAVEKKERVGRRRARTAAARAGARRPRPETGTRARPR